MALTAGEYVDKSATAVFTILFALNNQKELSSVCFTDALPSLQELRGDIHHSDFAFVGIVLCPWRQS